MAGDLVQNPNGAFALPTANESGAKVTNSANLNTAIQGVIEMEGYTDYPIHITCSSCKHFHRHKRLGISRDPSQGSRFHCEVCDKPLFGIGRSSTQVTFASAESRPPNPLHLSFPFSQICKDRLRQRSPSGLRSSLQPPSPSEPAASPAQTPAVDPPSEGLAMDESKHQLTSSGGPETRAPLTRQEALRRRLVSHLSNFRTIPRRLIARLRARRPRRQQARQHLPKEVEAIGLHIDDNPAGIRKLKPHANSAENGTNSSPQRSPSTKIIDRRSQSLPPSRSDFDRATEPAVSSRHPKTDELQKRRTERTLLARKFTCECINGCLCKCTECECPHHSHVASEIASSNGTRSPPNTDNIPGHILDRPEPFLGLSAMGEQFDRSTLRLNVDLNGYGHDPSRLSQLSTEAGTHETRAPSTNSSTLESSTGNSHRPIGYPAFHPQADLGVLDAGLANSAGPFHVDRHDFESSVPVAYAPPRSDEGDEHSPEDEGPVALADNAVRDDFPNGHAP